MSAFLVFLIAALAYTCLEVVYWYRKWYGHLDKSQPMPIVKSLLFAVLYAHAMMLINIFYQGCYGANILSSGFSTTLILLGAASHLIPVWRQSIHEAASIGHYLVRTAIVGTLAMVIHAIF